MTITANTCIECGLEWDDHTVRSMRDHWPAAHPPLDAPYAELDAQPVYLPVASMADGVTIGGAAADIPAAAQLAGLPAALPVLFFRFESGANTIAEITLVMGEQQMRALRTLVGDAIDGSLRAVRRARR